MTEEFRTDMARIADANDPSHLRCYGCAFRLDTEANRDALTVLKAAKCLNNNGNFFCHEGKRDLQTGAYLTPCRGFLAARQTQLWEDTAWEVAHTYG